MHFSLSKLPSAVNWVISLATMVGSMSVFEAIIHLASITNDGDYFFLLAAFHTAFVSKYLECREK